MTIISPGFNLGIKLSFSQASNKSLLHAPSKVNGANSLSSFNAAIQLTRSVLLPDFSP